MPEAPLQPKNHICYHLFMLFILSQRLKLFLKWYFLDSTKYLFVVGGRALKILNNDFSLLLNLRLLFTPLYGDYTIQGRIFGFMIRPLEVILGFLALTLFLCLYLGTIVLWLCAPVFLFWIYRWEAIIPSILLVLLYLFKYRKTPVSRVGAVDQDKLAYTFQLDALDLCSEILKGASWKDSLKSYRTHYLMKKLEIDYESFLLLLNQYELQETDLIKSSYDIASRMKTRYVEFEQAFYAILGMVVKKEKFLSEFNLRDEQVLECVSWIVGEREKLSAAHFWQLDYRMKSLGGVGKGMTYRVTPFLDSISSDFTNMASKGYFDDIITREDIVNEIASVLDGSRDNVLLVGPAGSGKTSIIKSLSLEVMRGTEYKSLRNNRIVSLDVGSLIAGTSSAGEVAQRIDSVMAEVKGSREVILFIDEIHNIVSGVGGDAGSSVLAFLEPHISTKTVRIIGATETLSYRKYIEPNASFERQFEVIRMEEASEATALEILKSQARKFELGRGVTITFPALLEAISLSKQYIGGRVLPDSAINVLERGVVSSLSTDRVVNREVIKKEISRVSNVPVTTVSDDESDKLLNLEEVLKKRVIGQDQAISMIVKALQRARVGIRNKNKPIASFLFVGTTGVGKTETAKALATEYFGDEERMIRLDMSEYQEVSSLDKLIGTSDGTKRGLLTDAVKNTPFTLVLLDEIEKAESSVLLTFLQVLDDGRLTDSMGDTVNFTNTIIIATSNSGTKKIQDLVAQRASFDEIQEAGLGAVRDKFAPEFLNRFSGIIVYKPLDRESLRKIALLSLKSVERLAQNKGIKVQYEDGLIDALVDRGTSIEWGARPLNRLIEDTVETYLAKKILSKELSQGDELVLNLEVLNT